MHAHARPIEDAANTLPVLVHLADYVATFDIDAESAIEAARDALIESLGRGFEALRDPECAPLVGPIVPGAVMPGGARVPGTSLELEPAQAAFCISRMLCRAGGEEWLAPVGARAAEPLGAILAVADYQARKALMAGKPPPKVRDVLGALLKALEIRHVLAAPDEGRFTTPGSDLRLANVTAAALSASQLGGARAQILRAISHACMDGATYVDPEERFASGRREWAAADNIGRAVRHACQAVAPGRPGSLTAEDLSLADAAGSLLGSRRAVQKSPFGTGMIERLAAQPRAPSAQLTARFRVAVDRHFPARQAVRIKALFAAPGQLDDLPVNELIAALVTNGAR